jgi:hypothetical protein
MTPYSPIEVHQWFEGIHCIHLQVGRIRTASYDREASRKHRVLKHIWLYFIPSAGKLIWEKSNVFNEISDMPIFIRIVCWKYILIALWCKFWDFHWSDYWVFRLLSCNILEFCRLIQIFRRNIVIPSSVLEQLNHWDLGSILLRTSASAFKYMQFHKWEGHNFG